MIYCQRHHLAFIFTIMLEDQWSTIICDVSATRELAMNVKVEFYFAKYPRKVVPFSVSLKFNFLRKSACDIRQFAIAEK